MKLIIDILNFQCGASHSWNSQWILKNILLLLHESDVRTVIVILCISNIVIISYFLYIVISSQFREDPVTILLTKNSMKHMAFCVVMTLSSLHQTMRHTYQYQIQIQILYCINSRPPRRSDYFDIIIEDYFPDTRRIVCLSHCKWSNLGEYG